MSVNILIIGCGAREISIFRNLKTNVDNKVYFYIPYQHPYIDIESDGYKVFDGIINFSECYMYSIEKKTCTCQAGESEGSTYTRQVKAKNFECILLMENRLNVIHSKFCF